MRQLSSPTNLLLACLAAAGVTVSLGLPWYAGAQSSIDADAGSIGDVHGPLESFVDGLARTFGSSGTTLTGADALDKAELALLVICGATIVLALAFFAGILRSIARELLRVVPLAAPALVLLHAIDKPASDLELRWGLIASGLLAAFMASAAWHGSSMPAPKPAAKPYTPPPAPPAI